MILQGNQRGGAKDLALHLLKAENEHIEIHELRGFVSDNLAGALGEIHAVSQATRARQFLFSLSLNPPPEENVSTQAFEDAINRIERKLGLRGQPRAIVFHTKEGRRHCHVVFSRIDAQKMKAIPLPYTRYKLREISRDLYIENGWKMPRGFINSKNRDPNNFTLAQWQQAKRAGKDPRGIKAALQDCWAISDTQGAFQQALLMRGFTLARGDRRGFVVLDQQLEIYNVAKWVGIKAKDARAKLKDEEKLPSVQDARTSIATNMTSHLGALKQAQTTKLGARSSLLKQQKNDLTSQHKEERRILDEEQAARHMQEIKQRQARFNTGLRGIWDHITGKFNRIKKQNESETYLAHQRDRNEKDALIFKQLEQSRSLQARMNRLQEFGKTREKEISRDIQQYREIKDGQRDVFDTFNQPQKDGPKLER
ncbi:MAG: relaxase/mobilization nuclease domain-containing protein [Thiotrichaceae bacterium]|nr:relaxase/mobilization nuclease domain-containing protein [Thiotrichaceae bacterium]